MLNASPLQIIYDPFQVLPLSYDVSSTSVKAFKFTGTAIPTQIDLTCDCLTSIAELEWVSFDSEANTFII